MKSRWRGPIIKVSTTARRLCSTALGDAGHAPFARGKAGAADQGENQKQGADIAKIMP